MMNKRKSYQCGLMLLYISMAGMAAHAKSTASTQPASSLSGIQMAEQQFDFQWEDPHSTKMTKIKWHTAETALKNITDFSKLNADESEAFAKLNYKLGTYDLYVRHQADAAINKFILADAFTKTQNDHARIDAQMAFAYEQKYALSGSPDDRENALGYVNKVITHGYRNAKSKEGAFAYYVKGRVLIDDKEYSLAIVSLNQALQLYQSLTDHDANIISNIKSRLSFAKGKFEQSRLSN